MFDVVVVGGGAAGIAAAVGAARTGARVCLIERYGFLGGAATNSSVLAYCGFFDQTGEQVVAGVGQELLDRLAEERLYETHTVATSGNTIVLLDQETLKRVLDEMVDAYDLTLLLHSTVTNAQVQNGRIRAVDVTHRGGHQQIVGSSFVDASGDGVLIQASGAAQMVSPPESRQSSTLVMRIAGMSPSNSKPSRDEVTFAIDQYSMRYGVDLPRRSGIDVVTPVVRDHMMLLVDEHRDVLDVQDLTLAETNGRQIAWHYLRAFREGIAGWQAAYLLQTGPQIGIRETRRIMGETILSREDVIAARKRPSESVGRGGWPVEDHSAPGEPNYVRVAEGGYYDIPGGIVRSRSIGNLFAGGRLVSADPGAFASIRVMGAAFATGHAAGVDAALTASGSSPSIKDVQRVLTDQGAWL